MKITAVYISLVILLSVTGRNAFADSLVDSAGPNTPDSLDSRVDEGFQIRIGHLTVNNMSLHDTIDIILNPPGTKGIAGFDLRIGCESQFFDIVEVLKGELPDSCGWEFFRASPQTVVDTGDVPGQVWKITALAKISTDESRPVCLGLGRPASLCRLVVASEGRMDIPDHSAPIFFYWESCRDNVLSNSTGQRLLVSTDVIDYFDAKEEQKNGHFPTRRGTPPQCIDQTSLNRPLRRVTFHNGGVQFKLDLGLETPELSDSL
jgi:hypothetical protein